MQKMGINKFKNNNKKYFQTIMESKNINIENIKEINSLIIKPSLININQIKNSSKIRMTIKTDIKIIYLKQNDTSLYVYKTNYINHQTIKLPKILEGHNIDNPGIINKIKKDIYVENINTKILNEDILLSYFLIVNISITPTHCIAYNINNSFGDNIFLSHINGQVLTQKTFNQNMNYKKIKWDNSGSKVWFIAECDKKNDIFNVEIENKNVNKIINVNNYKNLNNFVLINKDEILIEYKDENKNNVYKLNTRKRHLERLTNEQYGSVSQKPYYDSKNKLTYILMGEDKSMFLYCIDINKNIDIIFNYVNILDYYVSYYLNNLIVKVLKENVLALFEVNISTKFINQINIEETYEDILDVKYLYDDENKKQILILMKNKANTSKKNNTLILYDLNEYTYETLINDEITNFDIDYQNLEIFIITKNNNLNYVKKINLKNPRKNKETETILKLPATIKDITIKKVDYEK